jgi:hypothetical protein
LSENFSIQDNPKQGKALSQLLFNSSLEDAITRVQVRQEKVKLNGTHQLLACVDDVNIMGENTHTIKKKLKALLYANKKVGLKANRNKTKYFLKSRSRR